MTTWTRLDIRPVAHLGTMEPEQHSRAAVWAALAVDAALWGLAVILALEALA